MFDVTSEDNLNYSNMNLAHDGGLSVTRQMRTILDKPGFISDEAGGTRLRHMFQTQYAEFDITKLSPFAIACMFGDLDVVRKAVESGTAPDLNTRQTPFQFGFVSFAVLGAIRFAPRSPGVPSTRQVDVIKFLIASGASPNIVDISGLTALHHACTPPAGRADLARLLLENGADVNAQTRYGEVPIFFPFQGGDVSLVDVLMEYGADLDIADANGDSPRKMCIIFGAEVTAVVQRWERKRKGEVAPREEKECGNCKAKPEGSKLKQCARCHVARYCSTECQRAHWKAHKPLCNPFCAETTVTLRPMYGGSMVSSTVSRADLVRQSFGIASPTTQSLKPGLTKNDAENRSMVIKVQLPVTNNPASSVRGSLYIYNKKRDFVCTVARESNPNGYDALVQVVRSRGVGGAKAYLAAELKNSDELVVKISEVLAEQPF